MSIEQRSDTRLGRLAAALRERLAMPPRHTAAVRRLTRSQVGMTLIEIMVVVAIIGLLMGAVGVVAFSRYKKAQVSTTKQVIKNLETAVQTYMMDNNGDCPKDLDTLYEQKIVNKKPRDAWGQPMIFKCPGDKNKETADIASKGPDKREGTEDDIKNWESER